MLNRILIGVLCIIFLCVILFFFGTPEAKETMFSISGNIFSFLADASIIIILIIILSVSIVAFFTTLKLRKIKEVKFENYILITNISFICGISSLLCLMVFTVLGIPDFMTIVYTCLVIFVGVLLILLNRTFIEPDALVCFILLDTLTKEIRVYFKGFNWRSIFAKFQDHIDLKADIASTIEDDFPTKTPGTMFKTKASVISRAYLGKDTDPIEERARKAMEFIKYKKTIKEEQEVFAKMTLQDFYKTHSINECRKAKAGIIFPHNCFNPLESRYPIKFSEPTVYDSQPDEKTLAQQSKLTDQKNFKTMMIDLMRSKKFGLEKQDAIVLAAFFSGIDWKKTIDQNDYNVNFTGLDPDLIKKINPDTLKAIATAAVTMKRGQKRKRTSSPNKKTT